jgi:CubicO group peptidase (beta-lactamase class C family)
MVKDAKVFSKPSFVGVTRESFETSLDSYVHTAMNSHHIPGLALTVLQGGETLLAKGYGFANLEHCVPVKPETLLQAGSIAKQFVATGIMLLQEEGKLSLDDAVRTHFPAAPETRQTITVRQLLSHTAGIGDYPEDFDNRKDYSEDEMVQLIFDTPLIAVPGETWRYSNFGYVLLGVLIHKVSGQFYGDYLQEKIFKPLGMTSTQIIDDAAILPNRAAGYELIDGELKNQNWVSPSLNSTADGAMYTTILDMAKWDAALYTEQILPQKVLEEMWTAARLGNGSEVVTDEVIPGLTSFYGLGWYLGSIGSKTTVEHGGQWQGFTSYLLLYPNEKLTVIILNNLGTIDPAGIAHNVANMYLR